MSDDSYDDLYPDLRRAGGLIPALQEVLRRMGSKLTTEQHSLPLPVSYARAGSGNRHSQVMIAAEERAFHVDFWCEGVEYGGGWAKSLEDAAAAIIDFSEGLATAEAMAAKYAWYEDVNGRQHERGAAAYVERAWENLLAQFSAYPEGAMMSIVFPLIEEASRRKRLRQLLPYTSLSRLCFSRTTGYPFTNDCPLAYPVEGNLFRVLVRAGGERASAEDVDVSTAVDLLEAHLPDGCGPAVHGTADDEPGQERS